MLNIWGFKDVFIFLPSEDAKKEPSNQRVFKEKNKMGSEKGINHQARNKETRSNNYQQ